MTNGKIKADSRIGPYRIVRLLGQGGMGAVYEVVHEKLGTRSALKAFTLDHGYVQLLEERFLAEGRILARLHYRNLVYSSRGKSIVPTCWKGRPSARWRRASTFRAHIRPNGNSQYPFARSSFLA